MSEDKAKNNIEALRAFRLKGVHVEIGEVVKKSEFAKKGDWQNLCHMEPAKGKETDAPVGKPGKAKAKGGLPGAA